jgi:hypothetical protein
MVGVWRLDSRFESLSLVNAKHPRMTFQIKTIAGQMQEISIYFSSAANPNLLFLIGQGIDCR